MRRYPLCPECEQEVDTDPVYESFCGHDDCLTLVWHGICLMTWREKRDEAFKYINQIIDSIQEHPMFRPPEEN